MTPETQRKQYEAGATVDELVTASVLSYGTVLNRLHERIKRLALDNELDHPPVGDILAVAMDEWLTTRGF